MYGILRQNLCRHVHLPVIGPLSRRLFPLVCIRLATLLALDLGNKSLVLLLVSLVLRLLDTQLLSRHEVGILAQLPHSTLALPLVLLLELGHLCALAVWVVVLVWVERLLELGDVRLDSQRTMVVELRVATR